MRGVVFTGNSTLEIASFPDPEPGPGEVVVEMKASGMCGSDLKFYRPPPGAAFAALGLKDRGQIIAGHEPAGVVAAVGKDVRAFRVGDRVMVYHYDGCHTCDSCRSGYVQMCGEGATVYGVSGNGGHADYMKVPEATLIHLPDELSFATGAAISCGTGTAFAGLVRMDVNARDTLAVIGQGPVGQSAVQLGKAMGARVIAVDVAADRVARAASFGADAAVDASKEDAIEAIRAFTGGRGVTKAIETSGTAPGRLSAVRGCAPWGKVVFVGEGGEVTLNVSPDVLRKQLTIMGTYTFSNVGQADCTRFIADHGLDVDALFTDRWALDQAEEAYRTFDKQTGGKAVFVF